MTNEESSKVIDAQDLITDARSCVECASLAAERNLDEREREAVQGVLYMARQKIGEAITLLGEATGAPAFANKSEAACGHQTEAPQSTGQGRRGKGVALAPGRRDDRHAAGRN
jgi:hypothetical protein